MEGSFWGGGMDRKTGQNEVEEKQEERDKEVEPAIPFTPENPSMRHFIITGSAQTETQKISCS